MIYLDTHVLVWLYGGLTGELSTAAGSAIEANELLVSPMVRLELRYLFETERITARPDAILASLSTQIGLSTCTLPFPLVVQQAVSLEWTRDPFDRIIVAQAIAGGCRLLTRDQFIHKHFAGALW